MDIHVFPIPIPLPTSLSTRFLWVFLVDQARALVSCIPPGLVICLTIGNIHAVFSKHPTLTFPHRVQKSVLYICVSFSNRAHFKTNKLLTKSTSNLGGVPGSHSVHTGLFLLTLNLHHWSSFPASLPFFFFLVFIYFLLKDTCFT